MVRSPIWTEKTAAGNKRYNKCGYACLLKHLKALHTFLLADSLATIYSRTCYSATKAITNGGFWSKFGEQTPEPAFVIVDRIRPAV
jgi:hypothetical protein